MHLRQLGIVNGPAITMPLFPLYALSATEDLEFEGATARFREQMSWQTLHLDDGTRAILVFDSVEKAAAAVPNEGLTVVVFESAYKFADELNRLQSDGNVTKIAFNFDPKSTPTRIGSISDMLEFIKNLPPELKGA
jgi:hypothetical protein